MPRYGVSKAMTAWTKGNRKGVGSSESESEPASEDGGCGVPGPLLDESGGADEARVGLGGTDRFAVLLFVDCGFEALVVLLPTPGGGVPDLVCGTGWSRAMLMRVSAATMPPIECPTSTTRTEGSMVGEGVLAATSRSITLF